MLSKHELNPFVVVIVIVAVAVVVFSVLTVVDALPQHRLVFTSVAIALGLALVAMGALQSDRASKGLVAATVDVFAWTLGQMSRNKTTAIAVSILAPCTAAASFMIGPASIDKHNFVCGSATHIDAPGIRTKCDDNEVYLVWSLPFHGATHTDNFECLDSQGTSWPPKSLKGNLYSCHSPQQKTNNVQHKPSDVKSDIEATNLNRDTVSGRRTLAGLDLLGAKVDDSVAPKNFTNNLVVATWNLRKFNHSDRRSEEAHYYIARIISSFDIVAIQEVGKDLSSLEKLMNILGNNWGVTYSGVSPPQGGHERFAYIYDKRKVARGQFSGTVVLSGDDQLIRPPYLVSFTVGGKEIIFCNVHIAWGRTKQDRTSEVQSLSNYLKNLTQSGRSDIANLILLGDFQSESEESEQLRIVKATGFGLDKNLATINTNMKRTRPYDQIAFYSQSNDLAVGRSGALDFFESVFRADQEDEYHAEMKGASRYEQWRSFQMSDHIPKWAEFELSWQD